MNSRVSHVFDPTCLRVYDFWGIVGETLSEQNACTFGRAYATMVSADGGSRVVEGYHGRHSASGNRVGSYEGPDP